MNLPDIVFVFGGVFVGAALSGVITWLVSRHYYKEAGDKLMQEATKLMQQAVELERLTNLNLHVLENAGIGELVKDASGKSTGLIIEGRGTFTGEGRLIAKGEAISPKSPNQDVTEASDAGSSKKSG